MVQRTGSTTDGGVGEVNVGGLSVLPVTWWVGCLCLCVVGQFLLYKVSYYQKNVPI